MTSHDPLCPQIRLAYMTAGPSCQCALIRQVKDEVTARWGQIARIDRDNARVDEYKAVLPHILDTIKATYRDGYAAALRDCQRFLEKVDTSGDCWMWLGSRNHDGYGRVQWDGKTESAHRVSASLFLGPIPDGAHVLHTCDEPGCVRPTHLFYGDAFVNMQDMAAKGRQALQRNPEQAKAINANGKRKWRTPKKDVCKNGHPLTGDNVRIGTNGSGQEYQVCVTCKREQSLASYHRRKEQS